MANPATHPEPPIELPLRLDADPRAVAGCALCAALAGERHRARARGDGSRIADLNVRLRRHLEDAH